MKQLFFIIGLFCTVALGLLTFTSTNVAQAGNDWVDTSTCEQLECGNSAGEKTQSKTTRECEYGCPTIHFEWTTQEVDVAEHYVYADKVKDYDNCSNGWSVDPNDESRCRKWNNGQNRWQYQDRDYDWECPDGYSSNPGKSNCRKKINTTYKTVNHSADVVYDKSNDPNKCHRPSDSELMNEYGMNNAARQAFKQANSEWKNAIETSCEDKVQTRTVSCTVTQVVACEEPTPTPTPTEEPTPTPTEEPTPTPTEEPTPTPSVTPEDPGTPDKEYSSISVDHLSCGEYDFRAAMTLRAGDKPLKDVLVVFTYNGMSKNDYTNEDGKARVTFDFAGEAVVKATPNNGFDSQETKVTQETNCQEMGAGMRSVVAGDNQVLGANTYAQAGVFEDIMMSIMGLSGATMTAVGAKLHAKKKN